jgi:D-sedoheptulose 7-phosphate isomerase
MTRPDTGSVNVWFDTESIGTYLDEYAAAVKDALSRVDKKALDKAFRLVIETAGRDGHIYVAGNGGSASIADHLCCDFTKGTHFEERRSLKTTSLVANNAVVTAIANDWGYDDCFAFQVTALARKGDLLILISSSGNSENVFRAAQEAKKIGASTIGLTGFGGGKLSKEVDVSLHVPFKNYGVVEDAHQMLMHVIAQFVKKHRESQKI